MGSGLGEGEEPDAGSGVGRADVGGGKQRHAQAPCRGARWEDRRARRGDPRPETVEAAAADPGDSVPGPAPSPSACFPAPAPLSARPLSKPRVEVAGEPMSGGGPFGPGGYETRDS